LFLLILISPFWPLRQWRSDKSKLHSSLDLLKYCSLFPPQQTDVRNNIRPEIALFLFCIPQRWPNSDAICGTYFCENTIPTMLSVPLVVLISYQRIFPRQLSVYSNQIPDGEVKLSWEWGSPQWESSFTVQLENFHSHFIRLETKRVGGGGVLANIILKTGC
jgi:hypothetical protein